MKPISILFFSIFILMTSVKGQLAKGSWMIGGQGSYEHFETILNYYRYTAPNKGTFVRISPEEGYFIKNKFIIGIREFFQWYKYYKTSPLVGISNDNTKQLVIGPFIKYYFLKENKLVNMLGELCYQYGIIWSKQNNGAVRNFSALTGPVIFFNSSIALELLIGYNQNNENLNKDFFQSQKSFVTSIGFTFHFTKDN